MLAQALQQVRLALALVHLVEVDILEVLGSLAVDRVDSPAAGKDTRQVVPAEVAVRIVEPRPAVPLVAVVGLQQASDAMCSHNSNI